MFKRFVQESEQKKVWVSEGNLYNRMPELGLPKVLQKSLIYDVLLYKGLGVFLRIQLKVHSLHPGVFLQRDK